jgi:hypothetical protein
MKKLILSIAILLSLKSFSQDSVKITIAPQAKDLEYISSFIFNSDESGEVFDSIKVKFRVPTPPNNNTTVSIGGYTMDWLVIYNRLNNDATALKANCTKRIHDILIAVNQTYLTDKLTAIDVADADTFTAIRKFGKSKATRQ